MNRLADPRGDNVVSTIDFGTLLTYWERTCAIGGCVRCNFNATGPCLADLNCDGVVNTLDLGILLASWTVLPATTCDPGCVSSGSMMASGGGGGASLSSMAMAPSAELETLSFDECIDLLILLGQDEFAQFLMDLAQSPQ